MQVRCVREGVKVQVRYVMVNGADKGSGPVCQEEGKSPGQVHKGGGGTLGVKVQVRCARVGGSYGPGQSGV